MKKVCPLIIALLISNLLAAQVERLSKTGFSYLSSIQDTLEQLANTAVNDTIKENRLNAAEAFAKNLNKALATPYSFQFPFNKIKSASIQYPADSSFRIITLQLFVNNDDYRYWGAIQKNTKELQLINLKDGSSEIDDPNYDTTSPEEWYGAIYYNIEQFKDENGQDHYLLFGYDGFSFFQKRKVLEVLRFDENNQAVFGAAVFTKNEADTYADGRKRIILQYTAEAAVRIQYEPKLKMIIHDHLIPMRARYGETSIPDGSYVGYQLKDGLWKKVEKVWNQVSEEAPREMPILSGRNGKDLFGN